MTSAAHEGPVLLIAERPDMLLGLLRAAYGLVVPGDDLRDERAAFADLRVPTYAADLVLVSYVAGVPVLGMVVEVQLARDARKRYVWPHYLASTHLRLECATCLVVITPDARVAAWAAEPITTLQPGSSITPLVLGPRQIPRIVDAATARALPELAVLSAMAHGEEPDAAPIAQAAFEAIASLDEEHARLYHDLVSASLGEVARAALEDLVNTGKYEYPQSDFAKKHYAKGREEGVRGAIVDLCTLLTIDLTAERVAAVAAMTLLELDALRAALVRDRRWPD